MAQCFLTPVGVKNGSPPVLTIHAALCPLDISRKVEMEGNFLHRSRTSVVDLGHSGSCRSATTKSNLRRLEEWSKKALHLKTLVKGREMVECRRVGSRKCFSWNWEIVFKFEIPIRRPIQSVKSQQGDAYSNGRCRLYANIWNYPERQVRKNGLIWKLLFNKNVIVQVTLNILFW